jgi:hypothetical protein
MLLYVRPGGDVSPDSSPSATGPTEADTDLLRSEGRWWAEVAAAIAAVVAEMEGGMEERRLLCL